MPRICPLSLASVLVVLSAAPVLAMAAPPQTWSLDPVHTRVMFAVEHAGFSHALGTISGSTGTLVFDRDDWKSARLDVQVPLQRLDLGDAKWNKAVLATNLIDAEHHPQAHFVSSSVEPVDADHAKVCGELTLRGVTRPLCMDVTLNAVKRHPLPPFHRTAGFSATATLSRAEFGITAWKNVIGDRVDLRIEAEALRDRGAGEPAEAAAPAEDAAPSAEPTSTEPGSQEPASQEPASQEPATQEPPPETNP
ncbi:polyisoprenoid-binding protein [Lysobacter arenosi]|uniref:Polyisoprenoid-binding protein n=1 Tax=Lysobacter arenosi TaxID=2795387 RepID=A0ABX7RB88_9GAMM|nr:YceI family protein [Lysobacter arenosi]QSX75010.1 polyisoprenoid-binding protein [Lysobacter arenosi]